MGYPEPGRRVVEGGIIAGDGSPGEVSWRGGLGGPRPGRVTSVTRRSRTAGSSSEVPDATRSPSTPGSPGGVCGITSPRYPPFANAGELC